MAALTGVVVEELGAAPMPAQNGRRVRLRAPTFRQKVVERKRLLAAMAAGREHQVVQICAPAGFGKTMLAAQLIDHDPRPSCWIALEPFDNDPVVLMTDLVHMLTQVHSMGPRVMHALESPTTRIENGVLPLLREEIEGFPPFVLVLDDVELVRHRESLAILSFLVNHARPGSQAVIVTRADAEIPLGRLRAAGEVLDVRAADLAFDTSETQELLAAGGLHLSGDQVGEIRDRTEGWAAGIALAMFSGRRGPVARDLAASAIGDSPEVAAYLIEEAVQSQPPEVRHFLLASSLLRRLSAGLCDAAVEIANSGQILAQLERESLFVVPLNHDGEWYRYHQLFRELLQTELRRQEPEIIGGVLSRAAAWHEDRGEADEAFEYAHSGGDLQRAGRILMRMGETLIARGRIETVRGWLGRCTPEEMGSDSQLALAGAWVALLSGDAAEGWRLAAIANMASDLEVPSADGATSLRSSLANIRATIAADGIAQMLRDGEYVVASERSARTRWILDGWRAVGTAHLLDGRPSEAIEAFTEVLTLTRGRPDLNFITVNCLGYCALAACDTGDWRRGRKWAREATALTTESGLQGVFQSIAPFTAHATVLLHDGLVPQATKALRHVLQSLPMLRALRWFEADISLRCADMSLDLGDTEGAVELADVVRGALNHYPDAGMLPMRLASLDMRLSSGGELGLTPSELRLVPFLSSHLSLQEIGDRIYLSRATVKTHTDSIYRKLGVSSRSAAVDRLEALGVCHQSSAVLSPV